MILGVAYGAFQSIHMINSSTQGLSLSMFVFTFLFVLINFSLAVGAYKNKATAVGRQILWVMGLGVLIYFNFSLILAIKAELMWDRNDQITSLIVLSLALINFIYSRLKKLPVFDPIIKGYYSLAFRVIPQLFLAYKITQTGGAGLALSMVAIFHLLTLSRIFQIFQSVSEAGWDRNRIGLAMGEIGNEITWIIVTVIWLLY